MEINIEDYISKDEIRSIIFKKIDEEIEEQLIEYRIFDKIDMLFEGYISRENYDESWIDNKLEEVYNNYLKQNEKQLIKKLELAFENAKQNITFNVDLY